MADAHVHLSEVSRASARRAEAERRWRQEIADAVAAGNPLRKVAAAAGISHVRVLQITRETPSEVTPTRYLNPEEAEAAGFGIGS